MLTGFLLRDKETHDNQA